MWRLILKKTFPAFFLSFARAASSPMASRSLDAKRNSASSSDKRRPSCTLADMDSIDIMLFRLPSSVFRLPSSVLCQFLFSPPPVQAVLKPQGIQRLAHDKI